MSETTGRLDQPDPPPHEDVPSLAPMPELPTAPPSAGTLERDRRARRRQTRIAKKLLGGRRTTAARSLDFRLAGKEAPDTKQVRGGLRDDETVVGAIAKTGGDVVMTKTLHQLGRVADDADDKRARQREQQSLAQEAAQTPLPDPDGGTYLPADAARATADRREQVRQETSGGSHRHRRVSPGIVKVARLFALLDFPILLFFLAGLFNVDPSHILGLGLLAAVMVAGLVATAAWAFLRTLGADLNRCKTESGTLDLDESDGTTRLLLGFGAVLLVTLAAFLGARMHAEVLDALGAQARGTALGLAVALAVISLAGNLTILYVHAYDGSDTTRRAEAHGRVHARAAAEQSRRAHAVRVLQADLERLAAKGERIVAAGIAGAGHQLAVGQRVVDAAHAILRTPGTDPTPLVDPRAQTAGAVVGYRDPSAWPRVDQRALDAALAHLRALAAGAPQVLPLAGDPAPGADPDRASDSAAAATAGKGVVRPLHASGPTGVAW